MATSFTAARAATSFPAYQGQGGGTMQVAYGSVTFDDDATLAAALTVSLCKLPPGATVVGGYAMGPDIDSGTETLDFDLGWVSSSAPTCYAGSTLNATDTDGFGNLGVIAGDVVADLKPVASIYVPLQGVLFTEGPLTFADGATVTAIFNADAAATGTGTFSVVVFYVTE